MKYYPEQVQEYVRGLSDSIHDEFGEDIEKSLFEKHAAHKALGKFLTGEEIQLNEKDLGDVVSLAIAETILNSLKEKGLVDSLENESEEEIFFLTSKGQEIRKYMKSLDENAYENFDPTKL